MTPRVASPTSTSSARWPPTAGTRTPSIGRQRARSSASSIEVAPSIRASASSRRPRARPAGRGSAPGAPASASDAASRSGSARTRGSPSAAAWRSNSVIRTVDTVIRVDDRPRIRDRERSPPSPARRGARGVLREGLRRRAGERDRRPGRGQQAADLALLRRQAGAARRASSPEWLAAEAEFARPELHARRARRARTCATASRAPGDLRGGSSASRSRTRRMAEGGIGEEEVGAAPPPPGGGRAPGGPRPGLRAPRAAGRPRSPGSSSPATCGA